VEKEYEVTLAQDFHPPHLDKLLHGVMIEGGRAKADRAKLEGPRHLRIVLTQGLNRQIHKMLWRVGEYDVERLVRVRLGPLKAYGMTPGEVRVLSKKEIAALLPPEAVTTPVR
jgi:pseudouridine synthase